MATDARLTFTRAKRLVEEAEHLLAAHEGAGANRELDPRSKGRQRSARESSAQVNKDVLYAAHLLDAARLEVLNQYHQFRGQEPPTVDL
jgi:hypothetical protein